MDVYEEMWKGLITRLLNAQKFSIRQEVTIQDMMNLMGAFEEHYSVQLKELEDKQIEEEMKSESFNE
jgi:hypothetical protein